WIPDFASTDTTTSPSGGSRYKPTTLRTSLSKSGSREILNVPSRHGCKPFSRHNRDTHVCDTYTPSVFLIYRAISPDDQCEIPNAEGGVVLVNASTLPRIRSGIWRGPPGDVKLTRPSRPPCA